MTRRNAVPLALLTLLAFLTFHGCTVFHRGAADAPPAAPAAPAEMRFSTESEWIAADVARAVVSMARYARRGAAGEVSVSVTAGPVPESADAEPSYLVAIDGAAPVPVSVVGHLWAPDTWAPLARAALGPGFRPRGGETAGDARADAALAQALTDPRLKVLLAEQDRISARLADRFTSPRLHEQAALVVGALALREVADSFADVRPALSRMTAHLAFARALDGSGSPGASGAIARLVVDALAGRQRDALAAADALQARASGDAERAWARALRVRVTGDYRRLEPPDGRSLLERLEYARALRIRLGDERLLDFLDSTPHEDVIDWRRLVLLRGFGVESGARFAEDGIEAELQQAGQVWTRYHGGAASDERVLHDLNEAPAAGPIVVRDGRPAVEVLDWGAWAAFFQRHLCASFEAALRRYGNLGRLDEFRAFGRTLDEPFGSLTLYPVAAALVAHQQAGFEQAVDQARALAQAHPERVTAAEWNLLAGKPYFMDHALPFPASAGWFRPWSPPGTAFDSSATAGSSPTAAARSAWTSRRSSGGRRWRLTTPGCTGPRPGARRRTSRRSQRSAGRSARSSSTTHGLFASPTTTCPRRRTSTCSWPGSCASWTPTSATASGRSSCSPGATPRRPRRTEAYIAHARNSVAVSNRVRWLVHYDWDTGRRARAVALAEMAGDVYSASGLETLGDQLDRMGRYDEAEDAYRRRGERYEDGGGPLGVFYFRQAQRTGDHSHDARALELLRTWFPQGLERLPSSLPAEPPGDGVSFINFGARLARAGLRQTDIVVGLDGYRVRTTYQLYYLSHLADDDLMRFVVWRDGGYATVSGPVPQRMLGASWQTYAPKTG